MVYNPHAVDNVLRRFTPGYGRLGKPRPLGDKSGFEHLRQHKYEIAKTKAEVVDEYYHVMGFVYERVWKSGIAALVAIYFYVQISMVGGSFNLFAAMAATAYAMYYWWHAGAAYSNWQEFELRPLLMPIEDIGKEQENSGGGGGH